ncbi:hypothetical protein SAMN02745163_01172 [Clostridium cavendishii DSM 21758]|uniref:Uncharacterized protein n=1 Tax=Clostridium cavendishii DSM 21758 TaxID=1121302 RepID=A0A1M6FLE9_9CLOT|nr:hypothetical protein [Clostridium cavendishii]SHI98538.1 hypothetical protein SAMN02745163_01172 [Clostridium cavendishii DSM 21758]
MEDIINKHFAKVKKGNKKSMEAIVDFYMNSVFYLAKSIIGSCGSNEDIDDVDIDFGNTDAKISDIRCRGKNYGGHTNEGSSVYTYTFEEKDLNLKEKLSENIDFNINALNIIQKGEWNFKVK